MEPLFAAKMIYNEEMYYNQVIASKQAPAVVKTKKNPILSKISLPDMIMGLLAFSAFFMIFESGGLAGRILQSAVLAGVFVFILKKMNGNKEQEKRRVAPEADDRDQAEMILESSGLAGEACTVTFGEDGFFLENSGIKTMYRYEGVAWIKETPDYFMIFWNRGMAIPVEKAGFYKGKPQQFGPFIEKKCNKKVEKVKKLG